MMQEGFIAPTLNLEEVDERCAMIKHVQKIIEKPVKTIAVQNFAFGGVNTILLLRKIS
jgi:3-oxoacyl-[acyl-carrier-protein] synthase II